MNLRTLIQKQVKDSGLKPYQWAVAKGLSKSTFRDVMRTGRASGRTLRKLQDAGITVADRRVIASLDRTA